MDFKKQKPIYMQIVERLCDRIARGDLQTSMRFPSAREVAAEFGVNPNTVMRSFEFLQNSGIIQNRRCVGHFVSENAPDIIHDINRKTFIEDELPEIFEKMNLLGITIDELKKYECKTK